jgi:hypothetical protein
MMPHSHEWNVAGDCRVFYDLGQRAVRCPARKCAALDCTDKALAPFLHCGPHKYLGRQLFAPAPRGPSRRSSRRAVTAGVTSARGAEA